MSTFISVLLIRVVNHQLAHFVWAATCLNILRTATDMPEYDDRQKLEGEDEEQAAHYSKTLTRTDLYGETKVYVNRDIAHERIVIKTETQSEKVTASETS